MVGAGTAGIPCAITAAEGGARVLLVEKDSLIGGTLHISGGHMAAAGTRRQAERGIEDSPRQHLADIRRISKGTARDDLIQIQARHGAETIDWLADRGFAFAAGDPRIIYGHEPYRIPRTYYGRDEGMSILEVLRTELERVQAAHDLTLWTNAPVTEIRQDAQGRVCGVTVYRDGRDVDIDAPSVVLATGGFGSDPELFEELEGSPLVSAAYKTSTGDGIHLGHGRRRRPPGSGDLPAHLRWPAGPAHPRPRQLVRSPAADQ